MKMKDVKLLSTKEAAKFLNVCERSIRIWTDSGDLKCFRIGKRGQRRFLTQDLMDFLEKGKRKERVARKDHDLGFVKLSPDKKPHIAFLYHTPEEQIDISTEFMLSGLMSGNRCIFIARNELIGAMENAIKSNNHNIKDLLAQKAIKFLSIEDYYLHKNGEFNIDDVLNIFKKEIEYSKNKGFPGLRVTGDTTWVSSLSNNAKLDDFFSYEEKINYAFDDYPLAVVCQYNLNRFSGTHILNVFRTHPFILEKGKLTTSSFRV